MKIPPIPSNEQQRLDTLHRLNILETPQEPRYDRLTRLAKQLFDVPIALVSLIDKNRQWFKSRQGLDICETPRDISFCAHAINGREILEVNDATQDPRFSENPLVIGDAHIRFYAGAPLVTHGGFALGTLCIVDTKPRTMTQEERDALRDLADAVVAEIELVDVKNAYADYQATKERLRRGQIYANIGTWEWNIQTGDLFWTEQIAPLFGYGYGDLETSYDNFLAALHPEDRPAVVDAVTACIEQGVPYDIEHRVVWPDGTVRWLLERGDVERDAQGKPLKMLGVVQDIHDRKQAVEAAEKANRAKSEFLSSMSHELRTPLNSIIGFSQLLALSELSEKQKKHLHSISTSGKHLLSLINDVLEFAKLESGKLQLNIESVDVRPIIERVVDLMGPSAIEKDIDIHLADWVIPTYIQVDPVRLKQVLVNLVSNGVKYNRPGGQLKLGWQIIERSEQAYWQLQVTDTGLGIAQEDLQRVFTPFDRLGHEGSNIEGTGIGLSITKDLVEQMGGWIEVSSEVNVGTTFSVGFLLDNQPQVRSTVPLSAEEIGANPSEIKTNQTLKVLYVEDNPANMKLMAEVAQLIDGVELRIAPSAENGLQQIQAWWPQLILLDINLPGMNGDEAIAQFRALTGYNQQTPTIFAVTANVLEEQVAHYQQVGFDQIIAKPFDLTDVIQQVEAVRDRMQHVS